MIARIGWDGVAVLIAASIVLGTVAVRGPAGVGHWVVLVLLVDAAYLGLRWRRTGGS